ncbi:MAG: 3'-5' exonuclease, partial [Polyangia bacterium]
AAAGEDDTQRLETEAAAVRVMTIHAAKGLEADYVFIYGGLTAIRFWRGVHALQRHETRWRCAGKPRSKTDVELIDSARHHEAQRLLYVAMTRARRHLYLPFFPATDADVEAQSERGSGDFDPFKKISGEYRHVNQRLRALAGTPSGAALFRVQPLSLLAETSAAPAGLEQALASWSPPAPLVEDGPPALAGDDSAGIQGDGDQGGDQTGDDAGDDLAGSDGWALLRVQRRGFALTSYSRLSEAEGGYHPTALTGDARAPGGGLDPLERLDLQSTGAATPGAPATAVSDTADTADTLPGGLASGLFLHAILEKAPVGVLPPLATWRAQPEIRRLIEAESRRWERDSRHFDEAARLAHAALTVSIDMPDGSRLPGLARAARIRREVDFLFPLPPALIGATASSGESPRWPEDRLVQERGFVRGALDVLFEHGGRVCFADWKSNVLPDYAAAAVQAHVSANYALQVQIYTLAVVRLLGITGRDDYDRRFGGLVYLFLRGLAATEDGPERRPQARVDNGLYVHRPDYSDVESWRRELASRRVAGAGGGW